MCVYINICLIYMYMCMYMYNLLYKFHNARESPFQYIILLPHQQSYRHIIILNLYVYMYVCMFTC